LSTRMRPRLASSAAQAAGSIPTPTPSLTRPAIAPQLLQIRRWRTSSPLSFSQSSSSRVVPAPSASVIRG